MYKTQMAGKKETKIKRKHHRYKHTEGITNRHLGVTGEKTGFQDKTENSKERNKISECKEIVSEMNQVLVKQRSLG